jgi:hypothetical protein
MGGWRVRVVAPHSVRPAKISPYLDLAIIRSRVAQTRNVYDYVNVYVNANPVVR